ncbi:MAG: flagellar protein FlaG [Nitrospirae bacterium]|nr:flagellar protein FlaG [Nitrospirota bacterium]
MLDTGQPGTAARNSQPSASGPQERTVAGVDPDEMSGSKPGNGKPDINKLRDAVNKANGIADSFNSYLNFSVDDTTRTVVVKVINSDTKEVIRQIPSEETLKLMQAFDKDQALLLSKKV